MLCIDANWKYQNTYSDCFQAEVFRCVCKCYEKWHCTCPMFININK